MFALHRLVRILSVRAYQLVGWNENARCRSETMGFLCEFLLVHGTAHLCALVRHSSSSFSLPEGQWIVQACVRGLTIHDSTELQHREKGRRVSWPHASDISDWTLAVPRKKTFIPWTAARNAMLATVRDGTECMVAVNYLPRGYLWASTLTYIQVGVFGTCSALSTPVRPLQISPWPLKIDHSLPSILSSLTTRADSNIAIQLRFHLCHTFDSRPSPFSCFSLSLQPPVTFSSQEAVSNTCACFFFSWKQINDEKHLDESHRLLRAWCWCTEVKTGKSMPSFDNKGWSSHFGWFYFMVISVNESLKEHKTDQ